MWRRLPQSPKELGSTRKFTLPPVRRGTGEGGGEQEKEKGDQEKEIFFKNNTSTELQDSKIEWYKVAYPSALRMQEEQNLWPQGVCMGSLCASRQMGHSSLLSSGGSNLAS